eukprot:756800-Hanusia_phi.AAC.1
MGVGHKALRATNFSVPAMSAAELARLMLNAWHIAVEENRETRTPLERPRSSCRKEMIVHESSTKKNRLGADSADKQDHASAENKKRKVSRKRFDDLQSMSSKVHLKKKNLLEGQNQNISEKLISFPLVAHSKRKLEFGTVKVNDMNKRNRPAFIYSEYDLKSEVRMSLRPQRTVSKKLSQKKASPEISRMSAFLVPAIKTKPSHPQTYSDTTLRTCPRMVRLSSIPTNRPSISNSENISSATERVTNPESNKANMTKTNSTDFFLPPTSCFQYKSSSTSSQAEDTSQSIGEIDTPGIVSPDIDGFSKEREASFASTLHDQSEYQRTKKILELPFSFENPESMAKDESFIRPLPKFTFSFYEGQTVSVTRQGKTGSAQMPQTNNKDSNEDSRKDQNSLNTLECHEMSEALNPQTLEAKSRNGNGYDQTMQVLAKTPERDNRKSLRKRFKKANGQTKQYLNEAVMKDFEESAEEELNKIKSSNEH